MDRAIDAATAEKRRIGGVHNGVNVEPRDVSHDNFKHRTLERVYNQNGVMRILTAYIIAAKQVSVFS
jgi:hypothetical protein